jgi:hypothetical protein
MAARTVSPEQAEIIVRSIEVLPSGQAVRTRGEVTLLDHAASFDATDLARAGRHLVHVVDPDGADRKLEAELAREERAAHLGRYLSITSDGAGGVRVKGRGSAEDGALLKDVLLPLATPIPATEPDEPAGCDGRDGGKVHDPREGGARMWDALIATVKHAMVTTCLPSPTVHPPGCWSRSPSTPSRADSPTARSPGWPVSRGPGWSCRSRPSVDWPATSSSFPSSSTPRALHWTSDGPAGWAPPRSGSPWCSATGTWRSPTVIGHR